MHYEVLLWYHVNIFDTWNSPLRLNHVSYLETSSDIGIKTKDATLLLTLGGQDG
jgi:hypothetical protein